jgi:electron transport complex protein RnfD
VFALGFEALMLSWRRRPMRVFLGDLSAVLTAVLFALCVPPWAPWWISAVAMAAAIIFGKHIYGGLGHNVFNPAMVGYAVVLICFPRELGAWPGAEGATLAQGLRGVFGMAAPWDTLAQATPLDQVRSALSQGLTLGEALVRAQARNGHGWVALAFVLGGAVLLARRVIAWHVPCGVLVGVALVALPLWLIDSDRHASPWFHWGAGAAMLGAFFIATDPVTGAATPRGRWVFGLGVGAVTVLIRSFGAYPDGVAFAVLLMNGVAPLLDRTLQPRVYGQ